MKQAQTHCFPEGTYTPFGYLDNPYHSAIFNRSGVIRSVPPLGFGFWVRDMPWPYGDGFGHKRIPNYLSLLHLSLNCDGQVLHTADDFGKNRIELTSRYHTKLMMSYNFEFKGLVVDAKYFLAGENSLICVLDMRNPSKSPKSPIIHATNIYGFPGDPYWGCDGLVSTYSPAIDAGVSKVWAYGDVFVVGSDQRSIAHNALDSEEQWERLVRSGQFTNIDQVQTRFHGGPDHIYHVMSYQLDIPPGCTGTLTVALTRGKNEPWAVDEFSKNIKTVRHILNSKIDQDNHFYQQAPYLQGAWPEKWINGWIYDLETIRMNIRPPLGIYKHHWDAMQVHTPRAVLGEASLDSMCLSYADRELAKEVMFGTFADAPHPNIPCSREDGSVNMICANGKECGTAPIWGLPFHVIESIYSRDGDDHWIRKLYPYLKAFLEWWIENRTDEDGWFHASCSWESGQDGSKRFLVDSHDPGAAAEFVRTVDIEAAMAHAIRSMIRFAEIAHRKDDIAYWQKLADKRIASTRSMYLDGWYRDIDARNNKPIILKDYYDIMMLTPVALGITTPEQNEQIKSRFEYFKKNQKFWLEWPSFWQPFAEAAWNVGLRMFLAETLVDTVERIYSRNDRREPSVVDARVKGLPEKYSYRIPGVANEFWPVELEKGAYGGAENYGWGATMPSLIIRNIIGFREITESDKQTFILAPALPTSLFKSGEIYTVKNLSYRDCRFDLEYKLEGTTGLEINLSLVLKKPGKITVKNESNKKLISSENAGNEHHLKFKGKNGDLFQIEFN